MKFLDTRSLIREFDLHPKKSLGQNFLIDKHALTKVIDAAQITSKDYVLEVGAGLGSLTYLLAQKAAYVSAVELDESLIPILQSELSEFANASIIQGDMLELSPDKLISVSEYVVVANIPYYITSALIRHLLEAKQKPLRLVLTMQTEVAERICASDGKMSLLALSVQIFGKPEITGRISADCFFPKPTVTSAILRITLHSKPKIPPNDLDLLFQIAHAGFSQKRKTIRNSFSAGLGLNPIVVEQFLMGAQIDPRRRVETITVHEWQQLLMNWKTNFSEKIQN